MPRLFFGVFVSPFTFLMLLVCAVLLVFAPFFVSEAIAEYLPQAVRPIWIALLNALLIPAGITYLYVKRFVQSGYGGIVFWMYTGLYSLIAATKWIAVFQQGPSFALIISLIILTSIAATMWYWAMRARKLALQYQAQQSAAAREDQIRIHTEAILRAKAVS